MGDVGQHVGISIDVSFGTISFEQDGPDIFACAAIALDVGDDESHDQKVNATLRWRVQPDTDTVLGVLDKCRRLLAGVLHSSADYFDAIATERLLYRRPAED